MVDLFDRCYHKSGLGTHGACSDLKKRQARSMMFDINSLQLDGTILNPLSPGYASAIQRTSELAIRNPSFVAFPESFDDIPKLILFARSNRLELAVKGGGGNMSRSGVASSEGGFVIDLSKLNKVQISSDKQTVIVQGGATWGDVYEPLSKAGLDVVGGSNRSVGVGGFLTCGGYSYLTGKYGMGCDNVVEATVALADGSIVKANPHSNSDLFLAIRGGMGQFGIILEFVLRAYPTLGPINSGVLAVAADKFNKVPDALQKTLSNLGVCDKLMGIFMRDGQQNTFHPVIAFIPTIPGTSERAERVLAPLRQIASYTMEAALPDQLAYSHSSDAVMEKGPKRIHSAGSELQDIGENGIFDVDLFKIIWERWLKWTSENDGGKESVIGWEWSRAGLAASSPAGQTALSKRNSVSFVVVCGRTRSAEFDDQIESWTREIVNEIRGSRPNGGALAVCLHGDESVEECYGEEMAGQLRLIKAKYDPENVWTKGYRF